MVRAKALGVSVGSATQAILASMYHCDCDADSLKKFSKLIEVAGKKEVVACLKECMEVLAEVGEKDVARIQRLADVLKEKTGKRFTSWKKFVKRAEG